jgi:hypothetical protein
MKNSNEEQGQPSFSREKLLQFLYEPTGHSVVSAGLKWPTSAQKRLLSVTNSNRNFEMSFLTALQ